MRVAILGNSGSGKTTLARVLAADTDTAVLDLDTIYWAAGKWAVERPPAERIADVQRFCQDHRAWIIEGCYLDLVEASFPWTPELIFLNPGKDVCQENCRRRPVEAHKFASRKLQDEKLPFLLNWVAEYYVREGPFSLAAHRELFAQYDGPKREVTEQGSGPSGAG